MKRVGQLWRRLVSFPNLVYAAQKAGRGKRLQDNVAKFLFDIEAEVLRLQQELRDGTYRPGAYRTFRIYEPKERLISAAPFRDRVVHHALCRVLEPIFERAFIFDSYACRRMKGTHRAINRFSEFARQHPFVLKCDIRQFFPSVDHEILKDTIARKIKDREVLNLVGRIIDASNPQDSARFIFPGDDLFSSSERRRGLPIGNQTSQFFSNAFLNPFDHFVKQRLGAKCYVRYVDDFVIFGDDKAWLTDLREQCREFLASLRLKLHPKKSVISRVADGTRFLGFRVFPTHRLVTKENAKRMRRRLAAMREEFAAGRIGPEKIRQRIRSWIGHVQHADSYRLRAMLLDGSPFVRCQVDGHDRE